MTLKTIISRLKVIEINKLIAFAEERRTGEEKKNSILKRRNKMENHHCSLYPSLSHPFSFSLSHPDVIEKDNSLHRKNLDKIQLQCVVQSAFG